MTTQHAQTALKDSDVQETHDVIASDKVAGTDVYNMSGDHIGSINRLILEKGSGRVAYAELSFGGFLGIGEDHYPLPWQKLNYDTGLGGYRVDVTKEQLEGAPKYAADRDYDWSEQNGRRIYDYYDIRPYWM